MDIMYILQTLEKTILEQHTGTCTDREFQGIILLKDQSKLLEEYLYVGQYSDGMRLLEKCPADRPITMFLSAEDVNQTRLSDCKNHNVVVSALDLFELYNRINIILCNYRHWSNTLREALCDGLTLQQLLNTASEMIQSQIYILNSGFKLIVGNSGHYFDDPIGLELAEKGSLSFEHASQIQGAFSSYPKEDCCSFSVKEGGLFFACRIHTDDKHAVTALLAVNPQMEQIDYRHLLLDFCDIVAHTLRESLELLLNQDTVCAEFFKDLTEGFLTDDTEIRKRLSMLAYPVKAFCAFVLVRPETPPEHSSQLSYFMQRLQTIFPETNMAICGSDIVILFSQEERPQGKLDFNYDRLSALMEQFHAHAGVSNASRQRVRLFTLYSIASATIRLGCKLHRFSDEEHVFSYEDYSMYYIIDLCATKYIETHHHNDLIYLIHPSIIKICRYDAEHRSNLRDVLYYYLLCGCSLNKTAAAMYMHRNTVLNKLNKINEITEIPLEDGYTRHRMIMSCLIMRYYEDYLGLTIRL